MTNMKFEEKHNVVCYLHDKKASHLVIHINTAIMNHIFMFSLPWHIVRGNDFPRINNNSPETSTISITHDKSINSCETMGLATAELNLGILTENIKSVLR